MERRIISFDNKPKPRPGAVDDDPCGYLATATAIGLSPEQLIHHFEMRNRASIFAEASLIPQTAPAPISKEEREYRRQLLAALTR